MIGVADHQMLQLPQFLVRVAPALVRKHAVGAGSQNNRIAIAEFAQSLVEGNDFSRTNKGEVERIKIQANPLALQICQLQILKLLVRVVLRTIVGLESKVQPGSCLTNSNTLRNSSVISYSANKSELITVQTETLSFDSGRV